MPRMPEASCAICMESLFNARDDLDEVLATAMPPCGHVFHKDCLTGWFKVQSEQYLAQLRENRDVRDVSPSDSEAPALCPTCRKECFANDDSGEPEIFRLYLNFAEDGGSSSCRGSSPVRWDEEKGGGRGKGKSRDDDERAEREVMGLARRAKGLSEEMKGSTAESDGDELEGTLRRVEGLREDMVSIKALGGVKTYVGGLTVAINNLRSALEANPTIPTLNGRIKRLEDDRDATLAQLHQVRTIQIPADIARAVRDEQSRSERKIKKVKEDMDLLRRALETEQVTQRAARRERVERDRAVELKMEELKSQLAKEVAEREALTDTLKDRTKALRLMQSKVESRRDMKKELEALQAENTKLRLQSSSMSSRKIAGARSTLPRGSSPLAADSSVEYLSASQIRPNAKAGKSLAVDESLEIDLPSFQDGVYGCPDADSFFGQMDDSNTRRGTVPSPRSHPTARTYAFDLDDEPEPSKKRKDRSKSKYFSGAGVRLNRDYDYGNDTDNDNNEDRDRQGDEEDHEEDVLVPGTSPIVNKRSRTNPFTTTKQASDSRRVLQKSGPAIAAPIGKRPSKDVIDLPTPERPSRLLVASRAMNVPESPRKHDSGSGSGSNTALVGQKSIVELLGVADKNGRLAKSAVSGVKVKRRA